MGPRVRAGIVLAVFFALGVLAGVALEKHRSVVSAETRALPSAHETAMADLRDTLDLDDDQAAQIEAIMAKNREAVQRAWEQLRPEVQAAMGQVHSEIAEVLRPDQRERFHDWLMRRREEHGATSHPPERQTHP